MLAGPVPDNESKSHALLEQSHPVDVIKKDDDLWSPRHSHTSPQPHIYPAGLTSEAAFLSHFLPAPGNHPPPSAQHLSSSSLRADLHRHRVPGMFHM